MDLSLNLQSTAARRMRRGARSLLRRMGPTRARSWYALALLTPAAVTYAEARHGPGEHASLFSYLFLILLLVRLGGLGPGLVGAVTSTVLSNYFILAPVGVLSTRGPAGRVSALFLLMAVTSVMMVHSLRCRADLRARQLDDFLRAAGHELKTPLTALTLQMQSLMRRADRVAGQLDRDSTLQSLQRQAHSLDRLRSLVNHVLDSSRIMGSHLELQPEPLELLDLVQRVAHQRHDQAAQVNCSIVLRSSGAIHGRWDRHRLEQVVDNLLTNALKYGRGAPVVLELRCARGQAWLTVTDCGVGVPLQDQQRIFQRFERATRERPYGGLGLGLWLSREIVEASGGSISVNSMPNRGATFCVCLPMDVQASAALPVALDGKKNGARKEPRSRCNTSAERKA